MNLTERKALAAELRAKGYNCAQCVLMAFPDITGLDADTAARVAAGLGSGVGAMGEICGVANAMAIAEGLTGGSAPADKKSAAARSHALCSAFAEANDGRITCRCLKSPGARRSCDQLIQQGVEILHNAVDSNSSPA